MHVRFGVSRQVEVDDNVDTRDIETTGGHVGSNQKVAGSALELVQSSQPSSLGELAVQRDGLGAQLAQEDGNPLALVNGTGENYA